jgi:hypothetical protein
LRPEGTEYPYFGDCTLKTTPSLQDGCGVYDLPVVETTGYITLSLRDREKVNVRIKEVTELNIMKNPACLAILSRHLVRA